MVESNEHTENKQPSKDSEGESPAFFFPPKLQIPRSN